MSGEHVGAFAYSLKMQKLHNDVANTHSLQQWHHDQMVHTISIQKTSERCDMENRENREQGE